MSLGQMFWLSKTYSHGGTPCLCLQHGETVGFWAEGSGLSLEVGG